MNNITREQSGIYKCIAENQIGSDNQTIHVMVQCKRFININHVMVYMIICSINVHLGFKCNISNLNLLNKGYI